MTTTSPFDTSLTIAGCETQPEQARAAAVTGAAYSRDPRELLTLLDMLGILEEQA